MSAKTPGKAAPGASAKESRPAKTAPALPEDDLDAMIAAAWARLVRGAADKRSAFNIVSLGTLGAQGWPEIRSVVLRRVDQAQRRVIVHTDRRSTKAGEIEADGRVSLLFWDPRARLQLRVWGQAQIFTDDPLVDEEWGRLTGPGQRIYRVPLTPGRMIESPALGDGVIEGDGRDAFAVVAVTVMRFDWLHLRSGGHRRARFDQAGDGWQGRWLGP
ncbi:MAG: pyridoxamine 5'-phosphate oxidase family protein [Pseudomonadota bacterium]